MSCYVYWDKISDIAEKLKNFDNLNNNFNIEKIIPLLDSIEEIAHDETIDFDSAKHILDHKKMGAELKLIRKFYVDVGMKLETEKALEILEADDPWKVLESFHFYKRYEKLIRNEAILSQLYGMENMVFIGGGPLPLTLIMINQFFGINGTSIELSPEIADISLRVLEKLGLDSEINVVCGDETKLKNIDCDMVMVAALAEPKKRVFSNVKKFTRPNAKIVYRTYTGMRAILYAPVTEEDLQGFVTLNSVLPSGKVNNTSVLIKVN
ncbi:MAG: methyltransferase [Methanobacteriales archaeon HGW-Methanobacteriales-1]|jgi:hypothetical protein|nr:MAG: methyltransferase [Methanobacteriales archaeon HGW-Methanobacteriales-1]